MPTNFDSPSTIIHLQLEFVEQFFYVYNTDEKLCKHWLTENTLDNLQFVYIIHKTNSKQYKIGLCQAIKGGQQTVEKRIFTQIKDDDKPKLLALIIATPAGHSKKDFKQQSFDDALFYYMSKKMNLTHDIEPIDVTTSSNTAMSTWFTTKNSTEAILTNLQKQCDHMYKTFTFFLEFTPAGLRKARKKLPETGKRLNFEIDGTEFNYLIKSSKVLETKVSKFPIFAQTKTPNVVDFAQIEAQQTLKTYRNALIYKGKIGKKQYTYYVFGAFAEDSKIYLKTRLLNDDQGHTPQELQKVCDFELNKAKQKMWVELPAKQKQWSWKRIRQKYFNNVNELEYFKMLKNVLGTDKNGKTIPHKNINSARVPVPWGRKGKAYDFSDIQPQKNFKFKVNEAAVWNQLTTATPAKKVTKPLKLPKPAVPAPKPSHLKVNMPRWWMVWQEVVQFEHEFINQRFQQHVYADSSKAQ